MGEDGAKLASRFQVDHSQVRTWNKMLLESGEGAPQGQYHSWVAY